MAIKNLGKIIPKKGVDYFTEEDIKDLNIPTKTSDLENDSGYATKDEIPTKTSQLTNDSNFITSIPSEYVTETELNAKGYLTSVPSTYKTKTENDALYQAKGDYLTSVPSEYVTETELNAKGYLTEHQDISYLARKDELHSHGNKSVLDNITQTNINNWNNKSDFSGSYNDLTNKPAIPTKVSQLTNDSSYASESYVTNAIANAQLSGDGNEIDLSGYATKDDLINKVDKETGKSLIADSEIERLASVTNYNDTEIKNTLASKANTSDIPTKVSQLTNDKNYLTSVPSTYKTKTENDALYQAKGNYLTSYTESDPTVPSHVKNITAANITNWNNKSDFSGSYADLTNKPVIPTKTSQLTNDSGFLTEVELTQEQLNEIAEKVVESQKVEFVESIDECVDTSKKYVLPDGYIYAYTLTDIVVGPSYTNVLPLAINADGTPYVGTNGEKGYKTGWRINSSRVEKEAENRCCTGFIPIKHTDTIRFKNLTNPKDGNVNGYIHFYGADFSSNTGMMYEQLGCWGNEIIPSQVKNVSPSSVNASDKTAYMRISTGIIDDTSIITINEEIVEGTTIKDYAWVNTGMTFVQSENEDRIVALETLTETHSVDIENLKKGITNTTDIAEWDAPIYDAHIPVFELSEEKQAMTNATNTPDNIYAMYDALMAKHPKYITKTDLGLCSDGINHVYRYDFCEPEPLHESNKVWSETKAKAIITTGIHFEWAGIYAMYYALEEIANNPELRDFRRNTHLIVVPVANPYATIASNYQSGLSTPNSYGVRNANGVEIHRNFEVDWILNEASNAHYGGPEPLSEVETQYIDNIMKNNTDAAFFLSCHNCGVDTLWGTGFIWASTATKYMCNVGYRVIDKMSDAWMSKYGEVLSAGIEEYKTDLLEDGETRLGWTGMSTSPGTEAKQATKYGIQGTNVEICNPFQIHGTKENPESSMSSFTMSRGAEVYTNFLLTAFGVYDFKDKKEYSK